MDTRTRVQVRPVVDPATYSVREIAWVRIIRAELAADADIRIHPMPGHRSYTASVAGGVETEPYLTRTGALYALYLLVTGEEVAA